MDGRWSWGGRLGYRPGRRNLQVVSALCRVRGRAVREGKPFDAMLPKGLEPPQLVARIVPDPDDEEYGLEVGEA